MINHSFEFSKKNIPEILDHYNQFGFFILRYADSQVIPFLQQKVKEICGKSIDEVCDQNADPLPEPLRHRLSRIETDAELKKRMLREFQELVLPLIGPVFQVSQTYHAQIKGGPVRNHIFKGYTGSGLEVEAPYALHQDFTGGDVTTSPSGVTFWIPLNTVDKGGVRIYPRTHQMGLLCNTWVAPDHPRLAELDAPVDFKPEVGQILVFNAMMLHGTAPLGSQRRISCDIRFFPFCGFLESQPDSMVPEPIQYIRDEIRAPLGDTLMAPRLDALAYLGEPFNTKPISSHSTIHWSRYVEHRVRGDSEGALAFLKQFVNDKIGFEKMETFVAKFSACQFKPSAYKSLQDKLPADTQKFIQNLFKTSADPMTPR